MDLKGYGAFRFIDGNVDQGFAVTSVVLNPDQARILISLEPGRSIFQQVQISVGRELHVDRITKAKRGHKTFHRNIVALLVQGDCHDPPTHPLINK